MDPPKEDPKDKDPRLDDPNDLKGWQEEVKAAGSLPGSSKNVRHKSHAFGDPEKLRYQICLSG